MVTGRPNGFISGKTHAPNKRLLRKVTDRSGGNTNVHIGMIDEFNTSKKCSHCKGNNGGRGTNLVQAVRMVKQRVNRKWVKDENGNNVRVLGECLECQKVPNLFDRTTSKRLECQFEHDGWCK
jgi:hypothetical protein